METIGSRILELKQDPSSVAELEELESITERAQKKVPFQVERVILADLGNGVGLDINQETKVVRMDKNLEASNDDDFKVHGLIHEGVHQDHDGHIEDIDILEALTEIVAGERSGQGAQTYKPERIKLRELESKSDQNIVQLFKNKEVDKINEIIAANDENYAQAA